MSEMDKIEEGLQKGLEALVAASVMMRDLADCLEDMTNHYVEVRNDLYGFEAAEEIEVNASRKMIAEVRKCLEGIDFNLLQTQDQSDKGGIR